MKQFWKNQRVLVTGHTGFKGSWLSLWLQELGAYVGGIALEPNTHPNLFSIARVAQGMESYIADICDFEKVTTLIQNFKPDIIFHMAAQPLVRYSYQHPIETYKINVLGTLNILECAKISPTVKAVVNITTDKCYENKEWHWGYRECDTLGGYDPYSNSKACSELVTAAYRNSYYFKLNKGLASARAGNVIGGGDWSQDRLVADIIHCIVTNKPVTLRNPHAIRPWQHVLEPLRGYLRLAEKLLLNPEKYSDAYNFGPFANEAISVEMLTRKMLRQMGGKNTRYEIHNSDNLHETHVLKLDISKSITQLNWIPQLTIDNTILWVAKWYQAWIEKNEMREFTLHQIKEYEQLMSDVSSPSVSQPRIGEQHVGA